MKKEKGDVFSTPAPKAVILFLPWHPELQAVDYSGCFSIWTELWLGYKHVNPIPFIDKGI